MSRTQSIAVLLLALSATVCWAQPGKQSPKPATSVDERIDSLTREVAELKTLVLRLESQLAAQAATAKKGAPPAPSQPAALGQAPVSAVTPNLAASGAAPQSTPPSSGIAPQSSPSASVNAPQSSPVVGEPAPRSASADWLHGVTINGTLDGYYEYNTNDPIGRANYLRAYDVSSNSFSLNQADLILESAPDVAAGKRAGLRIDLQYGQATATLQGNPANEPRPEIYRNVFQAYGTYVFPVGTGLTVDFGKWSSSLGIEGNYTKDQLNYSRSFWFDFLPFYHMGIRARYAVNDELTVNAWITNGTDQTEDFNNSKDGMLGVVVAPSAAISWTLNFYDGQEHPDVVLITNPTPAQKSLPNQQGTYLEPISNPPDGRLEIADSYLSWQMTTELMLAAEADYVQERLYSYTSPEHVTGGALYGAYRISPRFAAAARIEYLADVGGFYTGTTQYLKEGTLTFDYRPVDEFLVRFEYRRDESNRRYFLSDSLGVLESAQPTVGVGLVWWFGQKQGTW